MHGMATAMCTARVVVLVPPRLAKCPHTPFAPIYRCGGSPFFYTENSRKNTDKFCRSLSLFFPPMSGLPLFGVCTGLGMSPLYARRRAAETLVPEVCFRHLRWIGERRSPSSLVCVRVLRGAARVALHPSGCSTQPGGCET